ncbi:hypothetical protein Rsub_10468 [Raphidocelis subcapitata]|uniref:Uncharacterized protein n=1 Tax=Raphidocelis subcapitata TaxID=307507 RepID=A0A2V0PK85_9CHLO|nr:hypothetical protein Rsub_10468 [Raphidocelis subcapitata]|eukprot:GBF98403.1 hypothetical protein Rsub_10468 [Raphidocelis subcapitata]
MKSSLTFLAGVAAAAACSALAAKRKGGGSGRSDASAGQQQRGDAQPAEPAAAAPPQQPVAPQQQQQAEPSSAAPALPAQGQHQQAQQQLPSPSGLAQRTPQERGAGAAGDAACGTPQPPPPDAQFEELPKQPRPQQQQQQQQQPQQQQETEGCAPGSVQGSAPQQRGGGGGSGAPPPRCPPDCHSEKYARMDEDFQSKGLDTEFVAGMAPWFGNLDSAAAALPWAKPYDALGYPASPVRLVVAPLAGAPRLAAAAAQIAGSFLRLLPPGTKVFTNGRSDYHITLTMISHPADPRPNTIAPDGGLPGPAAAAAPAARRGATAAELAAELEAARRVVAAAPPLELQIDRVLLARSGTLLLTWTDPTPGATAALRRALLEAFPGAPAARQPDIIHSSLFRILTPAQLGPEAMAAIAAEAARWTERVRGTVLTCDELWYVVESEFSTIRGERTPMPMAGAGAGAGAGAL